MTIPDDWVALIDLDGTTADYDTRMLQQLNDIASPWEQAYQLVPYGDITDWLEARMDLIKRQPGFWEHLPPIPIGIEIAELLQSELEFRLMVLTKGPKRNVAA